MRRRIIEVLGLEGLDPNKILDGRGGLNLNVCQLVSTFPTLDKSLLAHLNL